MSRRLIAATLCSLALTGVEASAQTAQQEVEALKERLAPRPAPLAAPAIQFTSQRPPANAGEIVFTLQGVSVTGATIFDDQALAALYADRLGAEVALTEVYEIAAEMQARYRDADYIFTRVIVPAQEIADGVVALEVIEARIEKAVVEEPEGLIGDMRALAERMLAPLIGLENPTGAMLERTLILINDIPGVTRATAVPQVGESGRGALNLFVNVEREPVDGLIYGDNRQSPAVGRGLIGGSVAFNSYTEAGDSTWISYFNSFGYESDGFGKDDGFGDFDERNTVLVEHSRYLSADGLKLEGEFLYSRTRPGDELGDVGIEGDELLAAVGLSYPIYRTRAISLDGAIDAELHNVDSDVSNGALRVANDKLRVISAGIFGELRDALGYALFDLEVRQGLDILDASDPSPTATLSRADGRSDFTLIRASVERQVQLNDELSLFVRAGGQYAFTPLLASEEFAIGGLSYGRGFDPSEFTGDHGLGLATELRYDFPFSLGEVTLDVELYAFGDYGLIFNKGEGEPDQDDIMSAGAGVRLFLPQDYVIGLELAFPVDQPLQRTDSDSGRFFVNFSKRL